jgi:mxaJ protein
MRLTAAMTAILLLAALPMQARELRVCADPNDLPFSNDKARDSRTPIARDQHSSVKYTWWAQRRGFQSQGMRFVAGNRQRCRSRHHQNPYYRSTYVFVTRADRKLDISRFDDPRLRNLTIGVQMVGSDVVNTPPAHALARRGIVGNVRGYMLYGDYSRPNPPAAIVDAVAHQDIDIAVVWGPLAGYFAQSERVPLTVTPVAPAFDRSQFPMAFDIGMGVRKGDIAFRNVIDVELDRNRAAIESLLKPKAAA